MNNVELKPCAHCGSEKVYICVVGGDTITSAYVICNKCHCRTSDMDTEEDAIEIWNTRYDDKAKKKCGWCNKYDEVLCDDWGNCFKWCPVCGANLGNGY